MAVVVSLTKKQKAILEASSLVNNKEGEITPAELVEEVLGEAAKGIFTDKTDIAHLAVNSAIPDSIKPSNVAEKEATIDTNEQSSDAVTVPKNKLS